jgi:hypothetical protein
MTADADIYERAVREWRGRSVPLLPAASAADVARIFGELGHPLSSDVLRLYTTVGCFADYEMDNHLWNFWSLGRISSENRDPKLNRKRPFVLFADWLICSHLYAFRFENPDESSVFLCHDGWSLEAEPIARGVPDFLHKLLDHPDDVWVWKLGR